MKIVITGIAGFLGSHLADLLLERGYTVIGLDNLATGFLQNIAHLEHNDHFTFHNLDVRNMEQVLTVCQSCEVVVHLAAAKIPRYGNRLTTLVVNADGTRSMLEVARHTGSKFVFGSTSDVYGMSPDLPFREDSRVVIGRSTVARWAYAVSKLYDEQLCFAYQEAHQIPVTVLRFFGSYGPRHHLSWWGGPQSVFINAILGGQSIEIHGDGQQTRSFCYVSDTVLGIAKAIECDAANGEIFNIGATAEISILDLAQTIHELIAPSTEFRANFVPYQSFTGKDYEDVRRRVPDITKAERLLGFVPNVTLREGLRRTIVWQRALDLNVRTQAGYADSRAINDSLSVKKFQQLH